MMGFSVPDRKRKRERERAGREIDIELERERDSFVVQVPNDHCKQVPKKAKTLVRQREKVMIC